jgi:DNA-binding beta-propeller fold protein YncE
MNRYGRRRLAGRSTHAGHHISRRQRPCIEPLEDRYLLSVGISIGDATAIGGDPTLKFIDQFVSAGSGGLTKPARGSSFGPDGNLYVTSAGSNAVLRYDGHTGAFMDAFVPSGSGGLKSPVDVAFDRDGNLYVSSLGTNQVLRYDRTSGAFLGVFASGLATPLGITFGPDGSLYIANQGANEVIRDNNGILSTFVTTGSGGLSKPTKAVFGPDGNLYVGSQGTAQVLRYNGGTGAFIDAFASTNLGQGQTQGPLWLEFGRDGYLYTAARTATPVVQRALIVSTREPAHSWILCRLDVTGGHSALVPII